MQFEIDSVLPALRALIDLNFFEIVPLGFFILIFTLDFEILSTRRNDVAWSFCWTLNAVEIDSVLPALRALFGLI
jgi:hypothetical protein